MQSLKIKFGICLLVEAFLLLGCDKEKDIPNTKIYQTETTLEIEVRDKRNTGAYLDYWGYVFKVEERFGIPDTSFEVLRYHAKTNEIVIHKLSIEYLIYKTGLNSSLVNPTRHYFFACQDSQYYYQKSTNTPRAKTNSNHNQIIPKKTNKIYAEFK
jgi:hypothetical protein